jgi:hypothetical protein
MTMLLNKGNADPSLEGKQVWLQQCQGLVEEHSWKEYFQVRKDLHPHQHWSNALGVHHGQHGQKEDLHVRFHGRQWNELPQEAASFSTSKTNMWPRIVVLHSLISTNGRLLANHCMSKSQIRKMVSCCFFHYASGLSLAVFCDDDSHDETLSP